MDGEERLRRIERIVGPEALRRARETVRDTLRHWERVAERDLEWRTAEGRLTIEVPELELFEAIKVESSGSPFGPTYGNVVGP